MSDRIVYCEETGDKCSIKNITTLVRIDGIIALKNFDNAQLDMSNKIISISGESALKFYSEIEIPNEFKKAFGRLFSIVKDEDDKEQSTVILSSVGRQAFTMQSLYSFLQHITNGVQVMNLPPSMFIAIIDTQQELNFFNCDSWGINYPGLFNKYQYKKIIQEVSQPQTFGYPNILLPGFDLGISDCSSNNPNGNGYLYKTGKLYEKINLSSNEAAVSFCQKENCIVYYNDFMNKGKLRVLFSKTPEINQKLRNTYLYQSSNI
jgi:hypothetical protein